MWVQYSFSIIKQHLCSCLLRSIRGTYSTYSNSCLFKKIFLGAIPQGHTSTYKLSQYQLFVASLWIKSRTELVKWWMANPTPLHLFRHRASTFPTELLSNRVFRYLDREKQREYRAELVSCNNKYSSTKFCFITYKYLQTSNNNDNINWV